MAKSSAVVVPENPDEATASRARLNLPSQLARRGGKTHHYARVWQASTRLRPTGAAGNAGACQAQSAPGPKGLLLTGEEQQSEFAS